MSCFMLATVPSACTVYNCNSQQKGQLKWFFHMKERENLNSLVI